VWVLQEAGSRPRQGRRQSKRDCQCWWVALYVASHIVQLLTARPYIVNVDCDEEQNKQICGEYGVQGTGSISSASIGLLADTISSVPCRVSHAQGSLRSMLFSTNLTDLSEATLRSSPADQLPQEVDSSRYFSVVSPQTDATFPLHRLWRTSHCQRHHFARHEFYADFRETGNLSRRYQRFESQSTFSRSFYPIDLTHSCLWVLGVEETYFAPVHFRWKSHSSLQSSLDGLLQVARFLRCEGCQDRGGRYEGFWSGETSCVVGVEGWRRNWEIWGCVLSSNDLLKSPDGWDCWT